MKKISLLFMAVIIAFLVVGCDGNISSSTTTTISTEATTTTTETTLSSETTTMASLMTPSSVEVVDNIISFSSVNGAEKYRIKIYDSEDNFVRELNVVNGFDLSLLLSLGVYSLQIKAIANNYLDSEYSEKLSFEIINPNQISLLEGTDMNNLEHVRWLGRTYYDSFQEVRNFYFTASGFEIAFYGTELKVTLKASNYTILGKQPHLVAFIDGKEDPTEVKLIDEKDDPTKPTLIVLNQAEAEYTIVSGLEEGYHTVKLLKRSEAIDSNTAVKSISTDGYFAAPPQPKSFALQFIAASSSTGYGNLGTLSDNKTTGNSDGLRAFAYLTSFLLDSEISIFSASGWGVSRGWNTPSGSISETENIPNAFEYVAIDAQNRVLTELGKWDITEYIPDVIVVNLGTNDFNASGYSSMSETEKTALEERFMVDYHDFLILLNNMYPDAEIIVAYGLMNEQNKLGDFTLQIISNANETIGSEVVHAFLMEGAGTLGNPYGCNYHPNVQTSMNVAEDLAEFISTLTGRAIVREMID